MSFHEIQKKINLVLDEEVRSYAAKNRRSGKLGSMNIGLQSVPNNGWTNEGSIPELLFDKSDPNIIQSPNATLLLKLYSSLDDNGKQSFRSCLTGNLRKDSDYSDIGYFIFFVLYRIGEVVNALKMARQSLSGDANHGYSNVLGAFSMITSREYLEIDPKTYEQIQAVLLNDAEHDFHLKEKINLALLKHLERDLDDVNPEINTDRDKVVELWSTEFKNAELPSLIKEIEDYFREGDFSDTKFATSIGRIRVLLVEAAKRIALKVAAEKSDTSVSESSDDHHFFQYLKDKKVVTTDEWNILRSLYNLSSNEGAHSPLSNREYARLIKNMSYELILLFLSRYKLADA